MLQLKNITKDYQAGTMTVKALQGVSLEFRENEFVCVLGPSGCGKTTLLNIVGGLDQYTTGDLIINGISTKDFRDAQWDAYRNHSIGFVFQTYNLIPHQSVLSNVELALTLSGVSKSERTECAKTALEQVGLADQVNKKPNQLSGGQMQRVAIARALVNNPDILLADEPTGSLDSETSVQIMEVLKEISKEKLVIMVTHNPDLADRYSTRIVRLLDGLITSDSSPAGASGDKTTEEKTAGEKSSEKKPAKKGASGKLPSMSFFTALALSLNNLMTKKTRTFLTAFAGSIGIIGIALIMSLSNGLQTYISRVEEETLSSYPITIDRETFDITGFMQSHDEELRPDAQQQEPRPLDKVYVNNIMSRMINTMTSRVETNDLASFKKVLEADTEFLDPLVTAKSYGYDVDVSLYYEDSDGLTFRVNPSLVFQELGMGGATGGMGGMGAMQNPALSNYSMWSELIDNPAFLATQYDVIAGRWPEGANEVVLIVSESNRINDLMLFSLGLRGPEQIRELRRLLISGEPIPVNRGLAFEFEEILALNYKLVLPPDLYAKTDSGWEDMSEDLLFMQNIYDNAETVSIVGILRPNEDAIATSSSGSVGYTHALTRLIVERTNESEIVRAQLSDPDTNVFNGRPFETDEAEAFGSMDDVQAYIMSLPDEERAQAIGQVTQMREAGMPDSRIVEMFNQNAGAQADDSTYEENLRLLGVADLDNPSSIRIYPSSFDNKEAIVQYIDDYNSRVDEEHQITYTDYVGLLMSSVTTVINAISYILIAFVSISLVVSSIMIGIITYISVLERTKEIGILRSVGASKRDVSRVFNAETLIIGFVAGALGIAVTLILNIPANAIIYRLTEINNVAILPLSGAVVLVAISMILSLIAGLIPSRVAANKDPVVALRTE